MFSAMRVLFSKKIIFISKPRCGSTSVRMLLDKYLQPEQKDFAVDIAKQKPGYHPHITAPCLLEQLSTDFEVDFSDFKIFTITRHPLDMLKSYYQFFRPDINGRYNYQDGHTEELLDFNEWLVSGSVGMQFAWNKNSPDFVTPNDFSPLSLEALVFNVENKNCATDYFRIEDIGIIEAWLSDVLSDKVALPRVNSSQKEKDLKVSDLALARIRKCFPLESQIYSF